MPSLNDAVSRRECDQQGYHAENYSGSGLHQIYLDRMDQGGNRNNPQSVENIAAKQGSDLTGFFCARLNVVFFNLEEGVYEWRTRSMARSRRS